MSATHPPTLIVILILTLALPALASFTGTDVVVPSVGRGRGSGTSEWYTTVWVHNPNASAANVQFRLLLERPREPRRRGLQRHHPGRRHPALRQRRRDALRRGRRSGRCASPPPTRCWSTAGSTRSRRAASQETRSASSSRPSPPPSRSARAVHRDPRGLPDQPAADSEFRYNFGFVETAGGSATVQVTALDETGASVGSKSYSLGGCEARQYNITDLLPGGQRAEPATEGRGAVGDRRGGGVRLGPRQPLQRPVDVRDELLGRAAGGAPRAVAGTSPA